MQRKEMQNILDEIPKEPGVYFFKDDDKNIIYIGKASVLRNRVRQYFQKSRDKDFKTSLLVQEIEDIDWMVTETEVDALFLESEMIKRYMPKYNIEQRDNKHWNYVKVDLKSDWPTVKLVRRPMDDDAEYVGPFTQATALKNALKTLRKVFPYYTKQPRKTKSKLYNQIGLTPGVEDGEKTLKEYKADLRKLVRYLKGKHKKVIRELKKEMDRAAEDQNFERAANIRDQIRQLKTLRQQRVFGDKEQFEISKDQALIGLRDRLNLQGLPRRIEAYDISHTQGVYNVASMVVFTDGIANKSEYRKFKMKSPGNDDYAHMQEVLRRRFAKRNLSRWPKPSLIIIDGGKGQLRAALDVLEEKDLPIPTIGLAKRHETIIRSSDFTDAQGTEASKQATDSDRIYYEKEGTVTKKSENYEEILLPEHSHVIKLLQRIRDEAHRFAVTYHSHLRKKGYSQSILEEIPGIGPVTRKKLIKEFGSLRGVKRATEEELTAVVNDKIAARIKKYL